MLTNTKTPITDPSLSLPFAATLDEFGLLERLNHLAAAKYSELADTASGLEAFLEKAKGKYSELACFLGEIDDIHTSVGALEEVVAQLDAYTKRLGPCFILSFFFCFLVVVHSIAHYT